MSAISVYYSILFQPTAMQTRSSLLTLLSLATVMAAMPLDAQQASFVLRLGKDTIGVEQFTRSGNRVTGEAVSRSGAAVSRVQYDATTHSDGRLSSVTFKLLGADGMPVRGRPVEVRYTTNGDSVTRVVAWADSTQNRTFAAPASTPLASSLYGLLENAFVTMRRGNMTTGAFLVLGTGIGATLPTMALSVAGGDSIRQPSGMVYRVDREGRLQVVDGSGTTGKIVATRGSGGIDIAAVARGMKPLGTLSGRGMSRAHFATQQPGGVVMVDYGRPLVRDRTVWGGLLIPLDTIWRLGANEATHFATARELAFGDVSVPPGLYTLFLYNARSGPLLVVNKQVGQWGTVYDQTKDLVRIPLTMAPTPEHIEEFTITVRQLAPSRGAIEIAWGAQMASAAFTVK